MEWFFQPDRPIYLQLVEQVTMRIICGTYLCGDKLPSVRDMAQDAGVNPNTMQKALVALEEDALVFSKKTTGRFITEDTQKVQQIKKNLASKKTELFLKEMRALNFTKKEIQQIIENL